MECFFPGDTRVCRNVVVIGDRSAVPEKSSCERKKATRECGHSVVPAKFDTLALFLLGYNNAYTVEKTNFFFDVDLFEHVRRQVLDGGDERGIVRL